TLAITTFGDMDVSIINELPSGRKKIETYWAKENMLERILSFIEKRVAEGEQAYIICPLIEESDKLDIQDAVDLYHKLKDFYPPEISVGLMHGRLAANEKEEIMKAFVENKLQDRKSTRLNSSHVSISYAVFCLKKQITC